MSKDMAVEPQALVNQAVFAWLRINGYVLPGPVIPSGVEGHLAPAPAAVAPQVVGAPSVAVAPAPVRSMPTPVPVAPPPAPVAAAPVSTPTPAPVAPAVDLGPSLMRMAEIDADLEKLTKPWPAWAPAQADEEEEQDEVEEKEAEQPEEEGPAAAAAPPEEDPGLDANTGETDIEEPPADSTIVLRSVPIALYLEREGEEPIKVTSERFIIGRGPHCDLVIDSPRVSREHVALTRSGILFFIEDLNSSNGTWFGEERVTRRELESGDVINLGNEPVTFFLRGE
jgi:hypothetical protein